MEKNPNLQQVQNWMETQRIHYWVVPATDPHQNEYIPEFWQRRAFLSGFTGSAGDLVVTPEGGYLWTDSRYWLQAERELAQSSIQLKKQGQVGVPSLYDWLISQVERGQRVGIDPNLLLFKDYEGLEKGLTEKGGELVLININPVDALQPKGLFKGPPLFQLSSELTGSPVSEKISWLRETLSQMGMAGHLVSSLDSIAWLLNLRGGDIPFNPVFISYLWVDSQEVRLFVDLEKVSEALKKDFHPLVSFYPYPDFFPFLNSIQMKGRVLCDPQGATVGQVRSFPKETPLSFSPSPITLKKSLKNRVEIEGMKSAHVKDAVALVGFFNWLEKALQRGEKIMESDLVFQLNHFRSKGADYRGPSFETIPGYGEHGAIVHYRVTLETDIPLKPEGLLLVDSGGQYLQGTTDVTRTIALGPVTPWQRECYTRVLKGHIALDSTPFPEGTRGIQLDTLARIPLWEAGLNFGHGTGHGVGCFLCVHEGPQSINPSKDRGIPLQEGMVCSNEPGYYEAGSFGIRFENLFTVIKAPQEGFLKCDPLTLFPVDENLLELTLLTNREKQWINSYHHTILETLSPLLEGEEKEFLLKKAFILS